MGWGASKQYISSINVDSVAGRTLTRRCLTLVTPRSPRDVCVTLNTKQTQSFILHGHRVLPGARL